MLPYCRPTCTRSRKMNRLLRSITKRGTSTHCYERTKSALLIASHEAGNRTDDPAMIVFYRFYFDSKSSSSFKSWILNFQHDKKKESVYSYHHQIIN